jgi:hypothetical protein
MYIACLVTVYLRQCRCESLQFSERQPQSENRVDSMFFVLLNPTASTTSIFMTAFKREANRTSQETNIFLYIYVDDALASLPYDPTSTRLPESPSSR